jgi:hypothetical protein
MKRWPGATVDAYIAKWMTFCARLILCANLTPWYRMSSWKRQNRR